MNPIKEKPAYVNSRLWAAYAEGIAAVKKSYLEQSMGPQSSV